MTASTAADLMPSLAQLLQGAPTVAAGRATPGQSAVRPTPAPITDPAPKSPGKPRSFVARSQVLRASPHKQGLAARQYAELWFQALRRWKVREVDVPSARQGSATYATEVEFYGVALGGTQRAHYLTTPFEDAEGGEMLSEREVGAAITAMTLAGVPETVQLGKMLERLRTHPHCTPASLERERGWAYPRERTVRYAVAVLTLAVRLRDPRAEQYLALLKDQLRNVQGEAIL